MSFAPGHVSLSFAVWKDGDPLSMGSTGIGIVLPQGVHCAVVRERSDSSNNVVISKSKEIEDPVTLRALEILGFKNQGFTIYLRHDLPSGSGFGISGASALAACMEVEKDLHLATRAAHQAEIEFRTGLGDVMAISSAIKNHTFPAIAIRHEPGVNGKVDVHPLDSNFLLCISGLGRETSKIITDENWVEIINSSGLNLQVTDTTLRSVIKIGRSFTEKSGLMTENLSEIFEQIPIGSLATVAHLGTSIVAVSDDLDELETVLGKFGEIRKY